YAVLSAPHSEQALSLCARHPGPIQLLLTDVVLPRMSGRELAEDLTRSRPEMKVLYMSGYTDDAVVRHGVLVDGVAFLTKPFRTEDVLRKVRDVLDSGQGPPPEVATSAGDVSPVLTR